MPKIPKEFNESILRQFRDSDEILYFKWDLESDVIEFTDSPERSALALDPRIEQASMALSAGRLVHEDDVEQINAYLDIIYRMSDADHEPGKLYACKLRVLGKQRPGEEQDRYLWCDMRFLSYFDGERPVIAFGRVKNIHAEHLSQLRLAHEAEHDPLTGLLNKASMKAHAEAFLSSLAPDDKGAALLIIDADGFKGINDTFGHMFGDAVLTDMSMAIVQNFRPSDLVGRIGGDEFLVLFRELEDLASLERRCKALGDALRRSYRNGNESLPFSVSIGIALCPEHGGTYQELFQHADRALYEAKAKGRDQYCIYHASLFGNASVVSTRDPLDRSDMQQRAFKDNMIEFIFRLLYETTSPDATITLALGMFGKQFNLDRVAVDRFNRFSNKYTTTFEWLGPKGVSLLPGTHPPEAAELVNLRDEMILSRYHPTSYGVVSVCRDTSEVSDRYREAVEYLHLGAFAHVLITHGSEDMGCIGFESATAPHDFSEEEMRDLNIFSVLLGNVLLTRESDEILMRNNRRLMDVLDHMQEFIYIVDKDTYEPVFFNRTIRQATEAISTSLPCYQRFHHLESPCPGCPVGRLSQSGNEYFETMLSNWGGPTGVRCYNIQWDEGESVRRYALIIQEPF